MSLKNKVLMIGLSALLSIGGCIGRGEVVRKEYVPYKRGTKVIGYPPALLVGSLMMNLATTQHQKHRLYLKYYDFEKEKFVKSQIDVEPNVYREVQEGDWFVFTTNLEEFNK
jgi:hypothetical protein